MATEGLSINDNDDTAKWMRRLPKRVAKYGAAVVVIDHVTKSKDERGRWAAGAQHKLAGLTGAAYSFTTKQPAGRAVGLQERTGISAIAVEKDRPGYVRGWASNKLVGHLELVSYPDGNISLTIVPPDDQPIVNMTVVRRVLAYLTVYDGSSGSKVRSGVQGSDIDVLAALRWLVEAKWVRVENKGLAYLHFLTDEGRRQANEPDQEQVAKGIRAGQAA
jgi:hypothetical protein